MLKTILTCVLIMLPICCISAADIDKERKIATQEDHCLAIAIHKEARGEPIVGQRAVLDVVLNRMRERGLSACHVLKQAGQFPWALTVKTWKATQSMLDRLEVLELFVPPAVPDTVVYFNNAPFRKIGRFHAKIGNQWFYTEKNVEPQRLAGL